MMTVSDPFSLVPDIVYRIYTRQEIEQAKASPSFEQEYNLST